MASDRPIPQLPNIYQASALWTAMGLFGLLLGSILLVLGGPVFGAVEWLFELSRSGPNALSAETAAAVRDGIDTWTWAGFTIAIITLPLGSARVRARLSGALRPATAREDGDALPPDRYGRAFFLRLLGVLVFAGFVHWVLRHHLDTDWLEGEDGLSEWWSVATYLIGAVFLAAAARSLWATKHGKVRYFYLLLAVGFFLGAMEEISWGQRLVGWGTPSALAEINFQDETTLHNVNYANNILFEMLFWGSATGMAGGLWRATANLRGLNDRMRLLLPSLTLAPALLLIMVWRTGDIWLTANLPRLVMDHFNSGPRGSEVPEAMLGLCIIIYTFNNLRQARILHRANTRTAASSVRISQG